MGIPWIPDTFFPFALLSSSRFSPMIRRVHVGTVTLLSTCWSVEGVAQRGRVISSESSVEQLSPSSSKSTTASGTKTLKPADSESWNCVENVCKLFTGAERGWRLPPALLGSPPLCLAVRPGALYWLLGLSTCCILSYFFPTLYGDFSELVL